MSGFLQIEAKVEPQPDIIFTELRYDIVAVVPNVSAQVYATLFSADRSKRKDFVLTLEQPEYASWGSDDSFIVDWILTQLGVKLK